MAQDGRQARWNHHNQQRRCTILTAALQVIEEAPAGAEFHVQQIAARAGLNRTVVYRHFTDRADLDAAIRAEVIESLQSTLRPVVSLEGTADEIILRIISTYVEWTVAHQALHAFAVLDANGPFQQGIDQIAALLSDLIALAVELLGVDLDERERALVDPLAHGLVGAVVGAVRPWLAREVREPSSARMSQLLSMAVWTLLDGHLRRLGVSLDPGRPLSEALDRSGALRTGR
ncbi:MAG: TetR/AcrR family transcriptional regulator [Nocardioides sp.]